MTDRAGSAVTPIVALDVASREEASRVVTLLGQRCRYYKVGSELFTAGGPEVVRALRDAGCRVFLDLKLHDIPTTVARASAAVAELGASLLTVHASGGEAMLRAAVHGAGERCGVLGVTVLTSHDARSLAASWGREPLDVGTEVVRLASVARAAGARGVVCAGSEAAALRARFGDALELLVPGIRLAGSPANDQSRTVTPEQAARAGATYIVLGRAVTAARDPLAAWDVLTRELASPR